VGHKNILPPGAKELYSSYATDNMTSFSPSLMFFSGGATALINRPDGESGKTFVSGARGMKFKSRLDQISHMLTTTRHHCNIEVWALGAKTRRWASLTRDTRVRILSEYNKAFFDFLINCKHLV